MAHRRRADRQPASWGGTCNIEGWPTIWQEFRVLDVSMLGLGLSLHHAHPDELVSRHIAVQVRVEGDSPDVRLDGTIRNAELTPEGVVRVGVEFNRNAQSVKRAAALLSAMKELEIVR